MSQKTSKITSFRDWVIIHQEIQEKEMAEIDFNIQLEELIEKEKSSKCLRRSQRIDNLLKLKATVAAYEVYLDSIHSCIG